MTAFEDGPAAGTMLLLTRAPLYLRAVRGADGKWDALDQLTDQAHPDEAIVVYRREGEPLTVHINRARSVGGPGFFEGGVYRCVDPQPTDNEVRTTEAWRAWVLRQVGDAGA